MEPEDELLTGPLAEPELLLEAPSVVLDADDPDELAEPLEPELELEPLSEPPTSPAGTVHWPLTQR